MSPRRAVAVALVVVVAVVGGVQGTAGAASIPGLSGNCPPGVPESRTPPVPGSPDAGGPLASLLMPDEIVDEDPFAPGARVSIVDVYGYGGLEWSTYDLGCGGAARDPWAASGSALANQMMLVPITLLQFVGVLTRTVADPGWMGILDGPLESMGDTIRDRPLAALFPLAGLGLAAVLVFRARRGQLADGATDAAWWLGIAASVIVLTVSPVWAARQFDGALSMGMTQVRESFGPTGGPLADMGPVHRDVLYNSWLTGTFGSAESEAAQRYGADLFRAQAFTRAELERTRGNRDAYVDLVRAKNEAWVETAARVEAEYPDAYVNLQGRRTGVRWVAAGIAVVTSAATSLFVAWAGLSLAVALFTVRMFIVGWPIVALVGVFPSQRHRLIGLWDMLVAALIKAVVCGFVAGAVSVMIGAALTAPNTNQFTRLLAAMLISLAAWKMTAPLRASGMMAGANRWLRRLETLVTAGIGAKAGAAAGVEAGVRRVLPDPPAPPPPVSSDAGGEPPAASGSGGLWAGPVTPRNPPRAVAANLPVLDAVPVQDGAGGTKYTTRPRSGSRHTGASRAHTDPGVRTAGPSAGSGPPASPAKPRPAPAPPGRGGARPTPPPSGSRNTRPA